MDENKDSGKLSEAPDLSRAIEGILAHPELISTVAAALGKPSPVAEAPKEAKAEAKAPVASLPTELSPDALATIAPLLSGLGGIKGGASSRKDDPRACLLLALKPYLSAPRCQAIDEMLRLATLSELLRGVGGLGKGGH